MTTAPPEDQRRLLDVQALDTRTSQLAHARRSHPVLARLTELDGRLADVETSLVASRTAVRDLRRELAKSEADVEQVRSRADRDRARMDSGQGSAKDMQALSHELVALGRRQAELEDVELEVMERLEAHEAALAELDAAADVIRGQRAEAEAERDAAFATIDAEAAEVAATRAGLVQGLDAGLLALYDRLRGQLGGLGAAALRGRRCEGCRLELNPMDVEVIRKAAPDHVSRCEECGRILVRLPEPAKG